MYMLRGEGKTDKRRLHNMQMREFTVFHGIRVPRVNYRL